MTHESQPPPEVLRGYVEIAEVLHLTPDQARGWARAKLIPTFKMGRSVCARRSAVLKALAEREAAAMRQPVDPDA